MNPNILAHLAVKKHDLASVYYSERCSALSRFYSELDNLSRIRTDIQFRPDHIRCKFCFTLFRPENHKVRVVSRRKPSRRERRSMRKLSKAPAAIKTQVLIICNVCHTKTNIASLEKPEATVETTECEPSDEKIKHKPQLTKKQKRKEKCKKKQQSELSSLAIASSLKDPTLAVKKAKAAAKMLPVVAAVKKPSEIHNLLKRGKSSKVAHTRLQSVLKQKPKKNRSTEGGLHNFLSSL